MLLLHILILIVCFYLIAKITDDFFVVSLDKISTRWNLSPDMTGATLMAMGSSAPELFIALISVLKPGGHADLGLGTIVGSALFNILAIIGATALVKKALLLWQPLIRDIIFYSISILLLIWAFWDGEIILLEALIFILIYTLYVIAVVKWRKFFPYTEDVYEVKQEAEIPEELTRWKKITRPLDWLLDKLFPSPKHYYWLFFISIFFIGALCWALVESAVVISHILHIPEVVIALTVLAIGTSIPDMISSVIVAKQGRGGMAISNAIGSNIFDIFIGLGLPWLLIILLKNTALEVNQTGLVDAVLLLLASVFIVLFIVIFNKWKIGKRSGYFFILLYIAYLVWDIITSL